MEEKGTLFAFLDVFLRKSSHKTTAQGTSLSMRSAHPPTVLRSWPIARFQQLGRIVSPGKYAAESRQRFLEKLVSECPEHISIATLRYLLKGHTDKSKPKMQSTGYRMHVPFHPTWSTRPVRAMIRQITSSFKFFGQEDCAPLLGWKLAGKHLWRKIATYNAIG